MRIVIQEKKLDKHTNKLVQEEVALSNDDFEGSNYVTLTIGDEADVQLLVADLFTAVEAFHRHEVRDDEMQIRLREA